MEDITLVASIVLLVFAVLEIILFFKLWRMCDTVEKMGYTLTQIMKEGLVLLKMNKGNQEEIPS